VRGKRQVDVKISGVRSVEDEKKEFGMRAGNTKSVYI